MIQVYAPVKRRILDPLVVSKLLLWGEPANGAAL
jgi:hypothetical protein